MSQQFICSNCGYIGKPKKVTKGSFAIEIILWLLMIVPGVVYTIWRLTTKHEACPICGAINMIPLNSPRGQELTKNSTH